MTLTNDAGPKTGLIVLTLSRPWLIDEMSKDPYEGSNYKITKQQWTELNQFYKTIQPPAQNELYASGDHYLLFLMLRKMGFRPPSDAIEIYQMAGQILAAGWDE